MKFPEESLGTNKRGLSYRKVSSTLTHPPGHVVELLTDAGQGAQIRDPFSGRIVWTARTKFGAEVPASPPEMANPAAPFQPYAITSASPIRFPLTQRNGSTAGSITLPAGESLHVLAEKDDYVQVQARSYSGWIRKGSLEKSSDTPALAFPSLPSAPRSAPSITTKQQTSREDLPPLIPFTTSDAHAYRELVPIELTAQVLGGMKYPFPGQKGGFWTAGACPFELRLFWNPFPSTDSAKSAPIVQGRNIFIPPGLEPFSGRFKIAVDDPAVREQLDQIQNGDIVRLIGTLIHLEHPRGRADPTESSLTGSFDYIMLCRSVEKITEPPPHHP